MTSAGGVLAAVPAELDLDSIEQVHRHDGYVTIATVRDGQYRDRGAIRAGEVRSMFPAMAAELLRDSFYSINGFYRTGHGKREVVGLSIPAPYRRADGVRYLTSCFVDLDTYRAGITPAEAVGEVARLELEEGLPGPSCLAYSGRGVWCLWLLQDETGQAARAHDSRLPAWDRVQGELWRRLQHLGADAGARDLSRVTRIPGSINGKSGEEVRYRWLTDSTGQVRAYSLRELERALEVYSFVPEVYTNPNPNTTRKALECPARVAGWVARWSYRLQYLEHLEALRGGWQEGHRNTALFLLSLILRRLGTPAIRICEAVQRAGRLCGLPAGEAVSIVRDLERLEKYGNIRDETIIKKLEVTDAELEAVDWKPCRDDYWSADKRKARSRSRADLVAHRRELVRQAPEGLSIRQVVAWLEDHGLTASIRTVQHDLKAIGRATPAQEAQATQAAYKGQQGELFTGGEHG